MSRNPSPDRPGVLIAHADIPLVLAAILAGRDHWDQPRFRHRDRVTALIARLAAVVESQGKGGKQKP